MSPHPKSIELFSLLCVPCLLRLTTTTLRTFHTCLDTYPTVQIVVIIACVIAVRPLATELELVFKVLQNVPNVHAWLTKHGNMYCKHALVAFCRVVSNVEYTATKYSKTSIYDVLKPEV
eukprot:4119688-Amphidinium_carterae.1